MGIVFDGPVPVAYGQLYVTSRELPDMQRAFAGQVNGLCGGADPGALFLMTGTHSGRVRLRIEVLADPPPPAADEWEDVVEVPLVPRAATLSLVPWGDGVLAPIPLLDDAPRMLPPFRVRYCAAGMDAGRDPWGGRDPDQISDGDYSYLDQRPDRYHLAFWPVPAVTADAIVRRGSASADSWHRYAAGLSTPPTLWDQVAEELDRRAERERREEEYRRQAEAQRWGGRPPSDRLRRVVGNVQGIALLDRDLVDGIAEAGPATQRRIALWAARRAFDHAGIVDLPWLAPAWAALEAGEPLPPEYHDSMAMLTRILGERPVTYSISALRLRGRSPSDPLGMALSGPVNRPAMALPALAAAAAPDPLQAALEAVWAAATTFAERHAELLAEVRREFPAVRRDA